MGVICGLQGTMPQHSQGWFGNATPCRNSIRSPGAQLGRTEIYNLGFPSGEQTRHHSYGGDFWMVIMCSLIVVFRGRLLWRQLGFYWPKPLCAEAYH